MAAALRRVLHGGKACARQRELLILRTAWRCRCDYEWGTHLRMGRVARLTDEEITGVADHLNAQAWSPTCDKQVRLPSPQRSPL